MQSAHIFLDFSVWYYTRAFRDLFSVWLNFMWFTVHFFSIPLLLRTLFSPWRRMTDTSRHRSVEEIMEGVVMNTMSRIFGALVRLFIIGCGLVFLCIGVVEFCVLIIVWVCMPLLLITAMMQGVILLTV